METNSFKNTVDLEHLTREVKKYRNINMIIGSLCILTGLGAFWATLLICINTKMTSLTLGIACLLILIISFIIVFLGVFIGFRGTYYMILLKDTNMMTKRLESINSGKSKLPSETQKKFYIAAIIVAIIILIVITIFSFTFGGTNNSTPSCNHESCAENGPFPCYGKNNTCPNTTPCYLIPYCSSCSK